MVGLVVVMSVAGVAGMTGGEEGPVMLARPTAEQAAWQEMELGMFIHFAPNTWQEQEYDDLSTPLDQINPVQLDTDQWVSVAESMGAKYIIFVAKHVGGFCMWQTDTTDYGIKNTPWRGGKGDVLADLAESCRKRGMKLGVYLSPQDRTFGAEVGGRCATQELQEKYNAIYRQQLTEILSRYGEMFEVWFDGGNVIEVGDILKQYAPKAAIFQGKYATIRWVGNEDGFAPYPAWNAVKETDRLAGATAAHGDPDGDAWLPNECDARIRSTWFWNSTNADSLKTVDQLMDMYYRSVGHGAVLLLNHTPDTTGLIPQADAERAAAFGAEIRRRFGRSVAETDGSGEVLELDLGEPTSIDHVITMEAIAHGERVREYVLDGLVEGEWREIARGTAIGHKKIDRLDPVLVSKVRLRVTRAAATPIIRKLAVYNTAATGETAMRIATEQDFLSVYVGERPVLRYRYADVPYKPYVQELYSPQGVNVLLDAPEDHLHHHGLMYAISVDGVNFWEEAHEPGRQAHQAFSDARTFERDGVPWASFTETLDWMNPGSGEVLLKERRTLQVARLRAEGATMLVWQSTFSVPSGKESSLLGGAHYHGLGMRFVRSMDEVGVLRNANNESWEVVRDDNRLSRSRWCSYAAEVDGHRVTAAMFDHPDNPRHPATWFAMRTPFAYLSATLNLWREPMTLASGETLTVRYAVALWDGHAGAKTIAWMYAQWLTWPPPEEGQ